MTLRSSITLRSSTNLQRYASLVGSCALLTSAAVGCLAPEPDPQMQAEALSCSADLDCLHLQGGAGCEDDACVDAEGDALTQAEPRENVACDPLAVLQRPSELGAFLALASDDAGTHYLVDVSAGQARVFVSQGEVLVPVDVLGGAETEARLSLTFSQDQTVKTLHLEPSSDPVQAGLSLGALPAAEEAPELEQSLALLSERELARFELGAWVSQVSMEYHAASDAQEQLVVVRPQRDTDYASFRLFYGTRGDLVERRIANVQRAKDGGSTRILFRLSGGEADVFFPVSFTADDEAEATPEPASLTVRDARTVLAAQDKTPSALARFTFACFERPANGWSVVSSR